MSQLYGKLFHACIFVQTLFYSRILKLPVYLFIILGIDFDNIYHFAWNAGMRLVFDLNVLVRNSKNQWNSTNAEILLEYAIQKNYSQNLDLELGNGM